MAALRTSFRGEAQPSAVSAFDPLKAIAQPLLLPNQNDTPPRRFDWRDVLDGLTPTDHGDYRKLLRTKRAFGVGGLQLVIQCGLVQDWYNDDANRRDAMSLIAERGVRPLLDSLADKDGELTIFGKNDIRAFFKTFPAVARSSTVQRADTQLSLRSIRKEHPLRLRKVIEFLFLTEAVLRYRFQAGETKARFETLTGIKIQDPEEAIRIWDYMWIEPLIYTLDPPPRFPDVPRMQRNPALAATFMEMSGQAENALYWPLRGVPSTYHTAKAAAGVSTQYYVGGASTYAVAVNADQYDGQLGILDGKVGEDYVPFVENIVRVSP